QIRKCVTDVKRSNDEAEVVVEGNHSESHRQETANPPHYTVLLYVVSLLVVYVPVRSPLLKSMSEKLINHDFNIQNHHEKKTGFRGRIYQLHSCLPHHHAVYPDWLYE
uniref:Uncharacterized protein n=1 Tax=Parascaris equorum TaxID=6256 RepID=A0A914S552_PAREQ